ncbi:MAG: hypothetical protein AAFQ94_26125 [Bacteroidota bacterium]
MKPNKTALGIFTAIPFVGGIAIMIWVFTVALNLIAEQSMGNQLSEEEAIRLLLGDFVGIFVISLAIGLISFVLTIYYIIHAIRNDKLESNMKILWVVLLFFFSGIIKIIYYFAIVLPDNYDEQPQSSKLSTQE